MRARILSLSILTVAAASAVSGAKANGPHNGELLPVDARYVFAPAGFDDNDEVMVVLDGYLPSGCYRLTRPETTIDPETHVVSITPMARFFDIPCVEARIPYSQEIRLGVLAQGRYEVTVKDGPVSQTLDVAEATNAGPDDHLYAPVDSASVAKDPVTGEFYATLEGRFTDACMDWDDIKVIDDGKSVVVLPIIAMRDTDCGPSEQAFTKVILLPNTVSEGRHLLHVRSLNGQAVNRLFYKYD